MKNILLLLTVLMTSFSFGQKSAGGGVAKAFKNDPNQTLLFVYVDVKDKQEYEIAAKQYYKGNYVILSVEEFKGDDKYKDLNSYRFMVCYDGKDLYGENPNKVDNWFYMYCMIDRTEHVKYIFNKMPKDVIEQYIQKIESVRAKG
jgi:hypothetical protein